MANLSSRFALQESRFTLIEHAAELAYEKEQTSLSRQMIATRLTVLESNWTTFQYEHDNICQNDLESLKNEPYFKLKTYERCQEFYVHARAALLTRQEDSENSMHHSSNSRRSFTPISTSQGHRITLPRISLPTFAGDYPSWRPFHDLFSSMILENSELNSVEKMHYLKSCLSGEAARLISNMPVSSDTFSTAWETLLARYENRRFLISAQLDKILSLKPMKSKSAKDLRSFLTTVTECLNALRALGCQTHTWDPLLLHLLVRLLDTDTREAWEVRIGSATTYPAFSLFEEFLTCRTRAMENLIIHSSSESSYQRRPIHTSSSPRTDHRVKVFSATSGEHDNRLTCSLCKGPHPFAACSKYLSNTLQKRREMVAQRKLCYNCLGNHLINLCPSTRRCRKCGRKHHTTLHSPVTTNPHFSLSKYPQVAPATQEKENQVPVAELPAHSHKD